MTYCANANKATVEYSVNGVNKTYTVESQSLLPISIEVTNGYEKSQNYQLSFNGNTITTYSFTLEAPAEVPRNEIPKIYLISGTWDDAGTVGTYTSNRNPGQIATYTGGSLLIGAGYSIGGSVENILVPQCTINITLNWQLDIEVLKIFDKNGNLIFQDKGKNIKLENVACDDDCPPGQIKCKHNKYPGYCCIPCASTAAKINNLGSKAGGCCG